MRKLIVSLMVFAAVVMPEVAWSVGPEGRFVAPVVTVRKLSAADVKSAGSVEKAVWRQPVCINHFVGYRGNGVPTQRTELRMTYDNANLYLAFRCHEARMDKLTAVHNERDQYTWRDDSVSMILSPGNDPDRFFHLIGNVHGSRFDERDKASGGMSWNGNWTIAVQKEAKAWTALLTVQFKEFGTSAPKPGDVWGANFYRNAIPHSEKSYWSPAADTFTDPLRWGKVVFAAEKSPVANVSLNDITVPGSHPVTIGISNTGRSNLRLSLQAYSGDQLIRKTAFSAKPGQSVTKISVEIPAEGKHHISAAVVDATAGRTLARTGQFVAKIPENQGRISQFAGFLREHNPASDTARKQKAAVLVKLEGLSRLAREARGNAAKWADVDKKLEEIEPEVRSVRFLSADKDGAGYALGTETALRKVMRDKLFEGAFGRPARISACRNEFESTQVVVCSSGKALTGVSVSASELVGPNGAVIPADRVQINPVDFVRTRQPKYEIDYIGWYPDPLLENKPFDVPAGGLRPVWITVSVPKDATPGAYKGTIRVKPGNSTEKSVDLQVQVWDFELPVTPTFKTAFALFPHEIGAWWGNSNTTSTQERYKFLLDRKISPTNIYTPSPLPAMQDIPFCVENGMNAMCLVYTHNKDEKGRAAITQMLRPYEDYLKKEGWWDKAYLYGFDEIREDKYHELRDMYGWVKTAFPDLPRMCTVIPNPELKGYIDIWVPLTANWREERDRQYVKDGDQVWWYVCCTPVHPYANFFIDYPAIDPRIIFWQCWKYEIPGFLYYAINLWESNRSVTRTTENNPIEDQQWTDAVKSGKRWPEIEWNAHAFAGYNGDGLLVYPGPAGRFLSSIRLEAIRDGIEDYEYFHILSGLVKKAESAGNADPKLIAQAKKLVAVREDVVKSVTEYTLDPELVLKARAEVAEMIEKLAVAR